MKAYLMLGLAGVAALFVGCSATLPIRPTSFFLIQNDSVEEPVEPSAMPELPEVPAEAAPEDVLPS